MGKKYDSDIVGWITRGGKRIPIRKGEGKKSVDKKEESSKPSKKKDEIKTAIKKDKVQSKKKKEEKALNEKQVKSVETQVDSLRKKAKKMTDADDIKKTEMKIASLEDKVRTDEGRKTVRKMADDLIKEANSHADVVTKDLQDAVGKSGSIDKGLPYRVKTEDSLVRKMKMKARAKGITEEEYAKKVTDVLRFTDLAEGDKLVDSFLNTRKNLELKGYKLIEVTNTLGMKDADYRGINTLVKSPKGYTFELQFHTPQSAEIKEVIHKMYEEYRLEGTSQERKRELAFLMKKESRKIKSPKNIDKIENVELKG